MDKLFIITYNWLQTWAKRLHFSYKEMNVLVYFIIIPLTWVCMIDVALHSFILVPSFIVLLFVLHLFWKQKGIRADNLYDYGFKFILLFGNTQKQYKKNSVKICVILPAVIYVLLLIFILLW